MSRRIFRLQHLLVVAIAVFLMAFTWAITEDHDPIDIKKYRASLGKKNDKKASVEAFNKVYKVLMHPRCMNCHPAGDIPLQGDDSHLHNMEPRRGPEGKGLLTMKCANCHSPVNVAVENAPPGNPKWHMPPEDMKMVFQGKSAHELATLMIDINRNGHKDLEKLREHASDTLVKAGWNMGPGRSQPPLSYEEFKAAWHAWLDHGAYAPDKEKKK